MSNSERPLAAEADGLVMWLGEDVSPNQAHTVIEYLSDRELLNDRGEAFSTKFWEDWIQNQDWLPVQERERAAYECPGCGASISMAYLRPPSEKIHNRPFCDRCEVPMKRIGVSEVDEE